MVAILFSLSILLLNIRNTHNVCKDSGCGNARACSVALNEHGIFAVAFCVEQDDIVGTFQVIEGVAKGNFTQTYLTLAVCPLCYEAPTLILAHKTLTFSLELGIKGGQTCPEFVDRAVEERRGDKEVLFNLVSLYAVATFACQNRKIFFTIHGF